MKIAIYQIAIERDENRLAFQSLNHIISVSNGRVPAELYDCVFAGEVSAQTLEDIFYVFNMEHPSGYKGRSLSVSDVVEIFLASGGSDTNIFLKRLIIYRPLLYNEDGDEK